MPERKPFFVGTFWALRVSDSHAVVCLRQFHVEVVLGTTFACMMGALYLRYKRACLAAALFLADRLSEEVGKHLLS